MGHVLRSGGWPPTAPPPRLVSMFRAGALPFGVDRQQQSTIDDAMSATFAEALPRRYPTPCGLTERRG